MLTHGSSDADKLTYRAHWHRGMRKIGRIFVPVYVAGVLIAMGGHAGHLTDTLPAFLDIGLDVLMGLALLVVVPIWISLSSPAGIRDDAEDLTLRLGPLVDRLAQESGIDVTSDTLWAVSRLVDQGDTPRAVKLYRESMNVSWDEANATVVKWQQTIFQRKLEAILDHMQQHSSVPQDKS
ncbi:hypothetical protein [Singulisphaera sp. PoT]|uniref:hypothetical protein n=1 Tax=Singulisphaera sp. PoT TaxID=3411797 RepID=UPI003BF563AB